MCGIVGFVKCGSASELNQSVKALHHRGPDGSGVQWFQDQHCGLGHTRLSIIDLSERGAQPMYFKDGNSWIVFNGEIYNYAEIRQKLEHLNYKFHSNTDTEVILMAYHEWKEQCLELFNGMFTFCIYHELSGEVFIARDRLGIKPLYYWHQGESLAFSSEIKGLLPLKEYDAEPDLTALHTPAHYQVSPYSGFKDVLKLPPGHYLKFGNSSGLQIEKYWNIDVSEENISESECIEKLDFLLHDAVKLNLVADTPVGVMLSGGLDSSIISALMQQKMDTTLNSFTIKFGAQDLKRQGNVDDSSYASQVAQKFGFNHHEIQIEPEIVDLLPQMVHHLDEPLADPAAINTYLISRAAKERGISVLLSGMGADEVFSGYRTHLACLKSDVYQRFLTKGLQEWSRSIIQKLPESSHKRNYKYIRWLKRFVEIASFDRFDRFLFSKNSALQPAEFNEFFEHPIPYDQTYYYQSQAEAFNRFDHASYLTRMCLADTTTYMCDHNLTYCDKSMMAAGVEGRPTLIDHRIVEMMFGLNTSKRIHKNVQKYLLKKVSERYLPKEIIYRPKAPFSAPMRGWLKNELKEMVFDLLSYDAIKKTDIYNPNYVQKLITDNQKGIQDNSQLIWRLMVNQIWLKTFFNN